MEERPFRVCTMRFQVAFMGWFSLSVEFGVVVGF
jgi:hypothetical protein